jgi:hypothetical protein
MSVLGARLGMILFDIGESRSITSGAMDTINR